MSSGEKKIPYKNIIKGLYILLGIYLFSFGIFLLRILIMVINYPWIFIKNIYVIELTCTTRTNK
jgi:hypothetical protein